MTVPIALLALLGVAGAVFVSLRGIRITRRDLPFPVIAGLVAVTLSGLAELSGYSILAAWFGVALFAYVYVLEACLDKAREPRSAAARLFAASALTLGAGLSAAPLQLGGVFGAAASWIVLILAAIVAALSCAQKPHARRQTAAFKSPEPLRRSRR